MPKVMVTGGLGFLGSSIVRYLSMNGLETVVLSRTRTVHYDAVRQLQGVQILVKDIADVTEKDLADVGRIYHFASTVHNYHILRDPFLDVRTNVEGLLRLLEAARLAGNPEIIFASSWFVYGNQERLPVREDAPCRPMALYGATKLCAEHCLGSYGAVFSVPYKIVRLGNVFGPGDIHADKEKGALQFLLTSLKKHEPVGLYYGGDFIRDYLYVDDAIRGLVHVAEKGTNGEVYNLASGVPTRFRDLIDLARSFLGSRSPITSLPPTRFHTAVQTKDFFLNTEKIQKLGFETAVPLESGLRHVCESII